VNEENMSQEKLIYKFLENLYRVWLAPVCRQSVEEGMKTFPIHCHEQAAFYEIRRGITTKIVVVMNWSCYCAVRERTDVRRGVPAMLWW
jgi:hypothetical protein